MPALSVLFALACTPKATDTIADTRDDTAETSDTEESQWADEDLFRAIIDGSAEASSTLSKIASLGGLPIETRSGTWLFGCLCGEGEWALTGDHNDWTSTALTQSGDLHWAEVAISDPDGSGYKFTDGNTWQADPFARRYTYDTYGEISLVRASAAHLERWLSVSNGALLPRDLFVWVPENGQFTHLLLAHDGQNLFDPSAFWGGWQLQESIPDNVLVVGIANTEDRIDEYTHTTDVIDGVSMGGQADAYLELIHSEVRPLMIDAYGEPNVVGIMGSSLGGLVSMVAALQHPNEYDMAISLSGTMGWGSMGVNGPTIIDDFSTQTHQDITLYLDSGGQGTCVDTDGDGIWDDATDNADNYCENIQLRDVLESIGYTFDDDLWHWHEPGAQHNEAAWAARVFRPLAIFSSL